jgi:hypothetical protein
VLTSAILPESLICIFRRKFFSPELLRKFPKQEAVVSLERKCGVVVSVYFLLDPLYKFFKKYQKPVRNVNIESLSFGIIEFFPDFLIVEETGFRFYP